MALRIYQESLLEALQFGQPFSTRGLALRGAGQLDAGGAVRVYQQGYVARLTEALGETFEAIWRVLGDEAFFAMAGQYIRQHPATSYNLADYGKRLPAFLRTGPWAADYAFLPELAVFELLFHRLFHMPADVPVDTASVAAAGTANNLRIELGASVRLHQSSWGVYEIWKLRGSDTRPDPATIRQPECRVFAKRDDGVISLPVSLEVAAVLQALLQQPDLMAAVDTAAQSVTSVDEDTVAQAIELVVCEGLIQAIAPLQ